MKVTNKIIYICIMVKYKRKSIEKKHIEKTKPINPIKPPKDEGRFHILPYPNHNLNLK